MQEMDAFDVLILNDIGTCRDPRTDRPRLPRRVGQSSHPE